MSETQNENSPAKEGEHKTPSKRPRMSIIERAQRESEELIRNMGGSLDVEGGRRTRSSSARGTTPSTPTTPPPVKKARGSSLTPRRGRPKKNEVTEVVKSDETNEKDDNITTTPKKSDTNEDKTDAIKKDPIGNCTVNDVANDKKIENSNTSDDDNDENEEKTEVDGKKSNKDEKLDTISEEVSEVKVDKEIKESNKSGSPAKAITIDNDDKKKVEPVPEAAKKHDPIESMEVDGDDVVNTESKDSTQDDLSKNEVVDVNSSPTNAHENSIEKTPEPTIEEKKVDEIKKGNDVCEPKISSPTSTSDVVAAAQTCN